PRHHARGERRGTRLRPAGDAGDRRQPHRPGAVGAGGGAGRVSRPIRTPGELVAAGLAPPERLAELEAVAERYAVAISPAMAELIDRADPDDPIAKQFVPSSAELATTPEERADPI